MTSPPLTLAQGLAHSGMTHAQLWTRYFSLGGAGTLNDIYRHLHSNDCPDDHEHNIIAQALNDAFVDVGRDHPVSYRHLYRHNEPLP